MTSRDPTPRAPARFDYEPGLDGLRAVAVMLVLFYHARFSWAGGGFVGVSMFFTLSGFLITSILLREHTTTGTIKLGRFWARRYRRLLPAALAVQGAIIAMALAGVWNSDQMSALRGDALAAIAHLANWHFIRGDTDYGAGFAAPSPLEHFWSLAIEEQFYLLFPIVVLAALRWGRGRRNLLIAVLTVLTVLSMALSATLASTDVNRAYFGTDTRLAELTVGALAACLGYYRLRPRSALERRVVTALGVSAGAGLGFLCVIATVGTQWLYRGGLMLVSLATVALIVAAVSEGPVRRLLTVGPLVALGRISYGVYLIHWPVFLWLTPLRTGWDPIPLFLARSLVTVAGAAALYRLLERPIRMRRLLVGSTTARASTLAAFLMVVGTVFLSTSTVADEPDVLSSVTRAGTQTTSTSPPPAQRVLVVGDQLAGSLGPGLAAAGTSTLDVRTEALDDCGVVVAGFVKVSGAGLERDTARCRHGITMFQLAEAEFRPDVVVIWQGIRDAADRRLSATSPWITPAADSFADLYRTSLRDMVDTLGAGGAHVVVLPLPPLANSTPPGPLPPPDPTQPGDEDYAETQMTVASVDAPSADFVENDPARTAQLNALIAEVLQDEPDASSPDIVAELARRSVPSADPAAAGTASPDQMTAIGLGAWLRAHIDGMTRSTLSPDVALASSNLDSVTIPVAPEFAPRIVVPDSRRARVLVSGDSVAVGYAAGLSEWGSRSRTLTVASVAKFACPLARGGQYRYLGEVNEFAPECDWSAGMWEAIDAGKPDVVVLTAGIWDVADRLLPAEQKWRNVGDSAYDTFVLAEMVSAIDLASSQGASVALVTYPHFEAGRDQGYVGLPESEPARIDRLNELMREASALRPDVTAVIEFQAWLAGQPGGELDPAKRVDGLHFSNDYLMSIAEWMGPQLDQLARG